MSKKRTIRRRNTQLSANVLIGMPVPQSKNVNHEAAMFCTKAVQRGMAIRTIYSRTSEDGRNDIIDFFLRHKEFSHLFFLDADTAPPDYAIEKLLSLNKPVIAGLTPIYRQSNKKWQWSAVVKDGDKLKKIKIDEKPNKPFKAERVGGTTILIKRCVLEKIKPPYQVTVRDDLGKVTLSEDFYFTDKIKAAGFDLWVDPSIVCKHFHTVDLLEMARI